MYTLGFSYYYKRRYIAQLLHCQLGHFLALRNFAENIHLSEIFRNPIKGRPTIESLVYYLQYDIIMKVLVLGATGFIGSSVSDALVRAGHQVLGQTRNSLQYAKKFESREIEVLQSDPFSDDKWTSVLSTVDAVVDCLGGSAPIDKENVNIIRKAEQAQRHPTASKLVYIWTSGV